MTVQTNTKTQAVTKQQVWEAYLEVRKKGKAAGVDQLTLGAYETGKSKYLYKVWNRMTSGSYFPPAVRRTEIPKGDGRIRKLGIPTISDRVAQQVVKNHLEPKLEKIFHPNSFGYRPGRSAHNAIEQAKENCWKYAWVIDLDIEEFFDNLDHDLLMRALKRHEREKWVLMYIERWLKAPIQHQDGRLEHPGKGSPQGGVISPLLANLFLHYAFDMWMEKHYPLIRFERYADDIIVHCRSHQEASEVLAKIRARLQACKLNLPPDKTQITYCKQFNRSSEYGKVSFNFLGFTFKPKKAMNVKGELFLGFGLVIGREAKKKMNQTLRSLCLHRRTRYELEELAGLLNSKLRGWFNYYGRMYRQGLSLVMFKLNERLVKWASKRFKRSKKRAREWLRKEYMKSPDLFYHWRQGFKPSC